MVELFKNDAFTELVRALHVASEPDSADQWPVAQMELIAAAGGNRWNIPRSYGGDGIDSVEMLEVYRELASGSLLTTFILTQRNAACQRIETSTNIAFADKLMTALCRGELFATVGISHLTTSRQHLQSPAVSVIEQPDERGFRLNGCVPWATAAQQADIIVTGGTMADGRQILAAVPRRREGVMVSPPIALMGLSSSQTSNVELNDVYISQDEILHGPVSRVLSAASGGGAGSLGTSAVAIGTSQGVLQRFREEIDSRPALNEFYAPLAKEAFELTVQLREAARGTGTTELHSAESLRRRANSLVLRSSQAWLAATKGAGYTAGHPAEKAVRESMFFLVWSCPQLVLEGNLRELSCAVPEQQTSLGS